MEGKARVRTSAKRESCKFSLVDTRVVPLFVGGMTPNIGNPFGVPQRTLKGCAVLTEGAESILQ